MPASEAAARLRIAVIGLSGEEVGWASQLAGDGVEVVVVHDVHGLAAADAQLGLVLSTPERVAELLPRLAEQPIPPIALFLERRDGGDRRHEVSLLKILISGKREWEKTFDSILDPIMVIDGAGRVIRANVT